MKKVLLITLMTAILLLGACAGGADTPAVQDEPVAGEFSESDLTFVYGGTQFPLNSDAALLLEALGSEYELTEAPSCVYVGEDKLFEYSDISIATYPLDGKDLIDEIYIIGGDYQTTKGIKIGSSEQEVAEQYGQNENESGDIIYALNGSIDDPKSPKLTFEMTDGAVSGISFYAASNVQE